MKMNKRVDFKNLDKEHFSKIFPTHRNDELGIIYNVSENTIRMWGSKLKLNKAIWIWHRNDENFVLKYYGKKKYSIAEIAEKLGRSRWSVINKFRELSGKRKKKVD